MTKRELLDEIKDIFFTIDDSEFPSISGYLGNAAYEDSLEEYDLLETANDIMEMDKPKDLPKDVLELVEIILTYLICEENNVDAMNNLGAYYYDGTRGFTKDIEKAFYCYEMAAEGGNAVALENLGYCYYYGRNVKVDYETAYKYFAMGAFAGRIISLYKIGDMYLNGYYVEQNSLEAFRIYTRCAFEMRYYDKKYAAGPVYLRLGNMYLDGRGTEKDAKTALRYFMKAERYLYDMVEDGSKMYKNSLLAAIEGQKKARKILMESIGEKEWME